MIFWQVSGQMSRHRYRIKNLLNDRIRRHRLRLGFVGQYDAMAEDVRADVFDVLGDHVIAALQERPGLGGEGEENRRARGGAELDEMSVSYYTSDAADDYSV